MASADPITKAEFLQTNLILAAKDTTSSGYKVSFRFGIYFVFAFCLD